MAGSSDDSSYEAGDEVSQQHGYGIRGRLWITIEHSSVCNSPPRFYIIFTKSGLLIQNLYLTQSCVKLEQRMNCAMYEI